MTGVCGTARVAYVTSLGAQAVIDYTQEDFADRPDTYDVIIDILGKSSFARCRRILKPHGRMVFVSFKKKQILQMLWTSVFSDKKVICALMTERQEDLVAIRTLVEAGRSGRSSIECFLWKMRRKRIDTQRAGPRRAPWSFRSRRWQPPDTPHHLSCADCWCPAHDLSYGVVLLECQEMKRGLLVRTTANAIAAHTRALTTMNEVSLMML